MTSPLATSETSGPREPLRQVSAETLGAELAASVVARALRSGDAAAAFAAAHSLDAQRVRNELGYLFVFTMHFCIDTVVSDRLLSARVAGAFYDALWNREPWGASAAGVERRVLYYGDALNNPHPELGRGYWVGRALARGCNATHDVAVIEFGARIFVSQLEPILEFLRGVVIV